MAKVKVRGKCGFRVKGHPDDLSRFQAELDDLYANSKSSGGLGMPVIYALIQKHNCSLGHINVRSVNVGEV